MAMVSARLDYCNSVLYGTSQVTSTSYDVSRICWRVRWFKPVNMIVSPILAELHWLPLKARIRYKIALMTFNILTTLQPYYLFELLQLHQPVRQLRSSQHSQLDTNRTCTVFANRAFRNAALSVWNYLPLWLWVDIPKVRYSEGLIFRKKLTKFLNKGLICDTLNHRVLEICMNLSNVRRII